MKLAIISFTERGSRLNAQIGQALSLKGYDCECYGIEKYADHYGLLTYHTSLKEWCKEMFAQKDGILFISATGIAVRTIAPFVQDKTKDPAIVVMDEKGVFAISLMSGHLGGANELTGILANLTGAIPVITTATDVNGRFAVDVFAKKNSLSISDMKYAKAISADVLDEKAIGFYSDYPIIGAVPDEISLWKSDEVFEGVNGICVTIDLKKQYYKQTLFLIPKILTVGVGCKKNTAAEVIERRILEEMDKLSFPVSAIRQLASIDLKAKEQGILSFAEKYKIPFYTYSAEELLETEGEFTESEFVASITGVSNVCERSAVAASDGGRLLLKKSGKDGVTVAIAVEEYELSFE